MNDREFLIEISRTKNKVFVIAFDTKRPDQGGKYSLEFAEKQMFKLLTESNNSFEAIIDRLYIHPSSDKLCLYDFIKKRHSPARAISLKPLKKMSVTSSGEAPCPLYYHNGAFSKVSDPKNKHVAASKL